MRNFRKALELLEGAYRINPHDNEVSFEIGVCLYLLEDYQSSLNYFTQSESLGFKNSKLQYFKGLTLRSLGNKTEALKAF